MVSVKDSVNRMAFDKSFPSIGILLFIAPDVTKPKTATKQLAESVDIYPTLAELAGLPVPKGPQAIDGVSLVSVLRDPAVRVRDHAFHDYPNKTLGRAICNQRYRFVEWRTPGDAPESEQLELYDYESDPLETKNLASEKTEVVIQMRSILGRYSEAAKWNP